MRKPSLVFAMSPSNLPAVLDPRAARRLDEVADVELDLVVTGLGATPAAVRRSGPADPVDRLAEAEVLFTCWGVPRLDEQALALLPKLRTVVHAAGSVKGFVTPELADRGITVSSAAAANAVPVAEYTVAMVLLAGKYVFAVGPAYASGGTRSSAYERLGGQDHQVRHGNLGRTIGIVGASRVGRKVLELLRPYDFTLLLADPTITAAEAGELGATLVDLDELVRTSDVVSIHAPDVPAARHMIDARRLGLLRPGATLINTARGRLVDTAALIERLRGGDLYAVLDVTDPEPLPPDSPLFALPNVIVTPHVAGSLGTEVARMGTLAVDEVARYARGEPYAHGVDLDRWELLA